MTRNSIIVVIAMLWRTKVRIATAMTFAKSDNLASQRCPQPKDIAYVAREASSLLISYANTSDLQAR